MAPHAVLTLVLSLLTLVLVGISPGRVGAQPATPSAPDRAVATPAAAAPMAEFVWQATGDPDAPLGMSAGAGVDARGNLWVTDGVNGRFVIFSPQGDVLETWGASGRGEGQFNFRCWNEGYGGVAFDAAGNIYVADAGNGRIQKFGPDRTFLRSWRSDGRGGDPVLGRGHGTEGGADGPSLCPVAVAVDPQGRVFVSERQLGTIQVFTPDGRPLATLTTDLMRPEGIALDAGGHLWVADTTSRILQFAPDGTLLAQWDSAGSAPGALNTPMGIAVDAGGRVFVSDQGSRVQVFAPDGAFLGAWGAPGIGPGQFLDPVALTLDGAGHLYVIEHAGSRVQKFRLLLPPGP
jgi:DNA-binding beta-propeller fold protein YncE